LLRGWGNCWALSTHKCVTSSVMQHCVAHASCNEHHCVEPVLVTHGHMMTCQRTF
jgi:hypothetical protein